MDLDINVHEDVPESGSVLDFFLEGDWAITPKVVEKYIRMAIEQGWKYREKGPLFRLNRRMSS